MNNNPNFRACTGPDASEIITAAGTVILTVPKFATAAFFEIDRGGINYQISGLAYDSANAIFSLWATAGGTTVASKIPAQMWIYGVEALKNWKGVGVGSYKLYVQYFRFANS